MAFVSMANAMIAGSWEVLAQLVMIVVMEASVSTITARPTTVLHLVRLVTRLDAVMETSASISFVNLKIVLQ